MVICASRSVNEWLNPLLLKTPSVDQGDYLEGSLNGSPVDRLVLTIAIVWGVVIIYKRRGAAAAILKNSKALLAFTLYLGVTVLWSDISDVSFKRWVRLVGNLVMAVVLMTEAQPLESVRAVFRRTAYLLIPLSVIFIKYFPRLGVLYIRKG